MRLFGAKFDFLRRSEPRIDKEPWGAKIVFCQAILRGFAPGNLSASILPQVTGFCYVLPATCRLKRMYARILLATTLAIALLVFTGEQRLLHAQGISVSPGPAEAPPQQQQQHPCQGDFDRLRGDLQNKGKSLQEAGKRKATPKELCSRINGYQAAESKMLKFLTTKAQECGIPPEAADNLRKSQTKTAELRTKICNAANNPGPAPQSPSAGLSGALNQNTGAVPETPSGGGIFDTLSGNVLQQ